MARKPEPKLHEAWLPARQVAQELRTRGEVNKPPSPQQCLEMAATLETALDQLTAAINKARFALVHGADYDPNA